MKKMLRRGQKWFDRLTGPDAARLRSEDVFAPTAARIQQALPPVTPSRDFQSQLADLLNQRALAMSARRAWYRTRQALFGAAAVGVAGVAGIAVVAWRRSHEHEAEE